MCGGVGLGAGSRKRDPALLTLTLRKRHKHQQWGLCRVRVLTGGSWVLREDPWGVVCGSEVFEGRRAGRVGRPGRKAGLGGVRGPGVVEVEGKGSLD